LQSSWGKASYTVFKKKPLKKTLTDHFTTVNLFIKPEHSPYFTSRVIVPVKRTKKEKRILIITRDFAYL